VINHVSEMGAYFYSFKIISQYGHVKVRNRQIGFFIFLKNIFNEHSKSWHPGKWR
jgi:hypothetical protein